MTTLVEAIRAFPAAEDVLLPACEALHCCGEMKHSSIAVDAGAAEALFACRAHAPDGVWQTAGALCDAREPVGRFVDAGWPEAALSLLSSTTHLESYCLRPAVKILSGCALGHTPCAQMIIQRGVLKVRPDPFVSHRNRHASGNATQMAAGIVRMQWLPLPL